MLQIKVPVTLKLEPKELDIVVAALEKLPYHLVAPLMDNLRQQIVPQLPDKGEEL